MPKKTKPESVLIAFRCPKTIRREVDQHKRSNPRMTLNDIYIEALEKYFSPPDSDQKEAAFAKRLDRIDRRLKIQHKDLEIMSEVLALFIRTWFTTAVELSDDQKPAAYAAAKRRWERFLELTADRVGKGKNLFSDLPETIFRVEDFIQDESQEEGQNNV